MIFQPTSISKPLTASTVIKLLQDGKVAVVEDVNTYQKIWKQLEGKLLVER